MFAFAANATTALQFASPGGTRADGVQPQELTWAQIPDRARGTAEQLGLSEAGMADWRARQQRNLARRIAEGSAEHIAYFLLQSRTFTQADPLDPTRCAHQWPTEMGELVAARAKAFEAAIGNATDPRHKLINNLLQELQWPVATCYRHTMKFLQAKEIAGAPLEQLYMQRGLSSDTAPENALGLATLPVGNQTRVRRILLAGPGLDLTRREKFVDSLPLRSHQFEALQRQCPKASVTLADVRPEVLQHLGAQRVDLTTQWLAGSFDLVVATNVLLYFDMPELLTAMAGLTNSLAPGGTLLHNDQRFATKHFAEALGLTTGQFRPVLLKNQKGRQLWDRVILHHKAS